MSKLTRAEVAAVTMFGAGFSPIAPATVASALTCLILWFTPPLLRWPWALLLIPATLGGVWMSTRAIETFDLLAYTRFRRLRRPNPNREDPDQVVIDEFLGQWITLLAASHTAMGFVAAFIAFRVMDILKPFGIDHLQKAKGGWGVVLDDLLAGVLAALSLWGARALTVWLLY